MTAAAAFLAGAGWTDAAHEDIASDASERRYVRLLRADGARAVLMRAPVVASPEAAAQFDAFRRIGAWLRDLGLAAPAEIACDRGGGLLLVEDLGRTSLAHLLDTGSPEAGPAYRAASGVIAHLAAAAPPEGLSRPSPGDMAAMTGVTFDRLDGAAALRDTLQARLAEALAGVADLPPAVSLRDMHGDNLIWRADRTGMARIGLLDYQDALMLPDGYDIASLLDDPRRDVPVPLRRAVIAAYAADRGLPEAEMTTRVDLLSIQRNARILGIFRRLSCLGRPAYARFLPRTRALLLRAAGNPELAALAPPVADLVERTRAWQETAA
jgi:aminoglycoside/choline kinase family phosphotransferase